MSSTSSSSNSYGYCCSNVLSWMCCKSIKKISTNSLLQPHSVNSSIDIGINMKDIDRAPNSLISLNNNQINQDSDDDEDAEPTSELLNNDANTTTNLIYSSLDRGSNSPISEEKKDWIWSIKDSKATFRIKSHWLENYIDLSYNIVKKNRLGQRMNRKIRLTNTHLIYIKDGESIAKAYSYSKVVRMVMDNHDTLLLDLRSGRQLMLVSPYAANIFQELLCRIRLRNFIVLKQYVIVVPSSLITDFNLDVVKRIYESNSIGLSETLLSFAKDFLSKNLENLNQNSNRLSKSKDVLLSEVLSSDNDDIDSIVVSTLMKIIDTIDPPIFHFPIEKNHPVLDEAFFNKNIFLVKEGSKESLVKKTIQSIVYDTSSPEGNTRMQFVNNFISTNPVYYNSDIPESGLCKSSLETIKHFINGLHIHIFKSKAVQLTKLLTPRQLLLLQEENELLELLEDDNFNDIDICLEQLKSLDQTILAVISFMIYLVVEESIFVSLKNQIFSILPFCYNKKIDDKIIIQKRKTLLTRTQSQWGIPEAIQSPFDWKFAIFELSLLENCFIPTIMLSVLIRTAKAIYNEYENIILPRLKATSSELFLSADEFLPIFMYVFIKCDLKHPILNYQLMFNLCHSYQLYGEFGYYLTTYESTLEFIAEEDIGIKDNSRLNSIDNSVSIKSLGFNEEMI